MKKHIPFLLVAVFVTLPLFTFAQQDAGGILGGLCENGKDCNFLDLMKLVSNVLKFLTLLTLPLATIGFAYAGWLLLTANGNEGKWSDAKEIFTKVLIGFIFVFAAWLIVRTITNALLDRSQGFTDYLGNGTIQEEYQPGVGILS
jgi:hypothetical protein